MKFTQHATHRQFYSAPDHKHILLFYKEANKPALEVAEIFSLAFQGRFALFFLHDAYTDDILRDSVAGVMSGADNFPNRLWWIESYASGKITLGRNPSLAISASGEKLKGIFNNFSFGENFKFSANGNVPEVSFEGGQIRIEAPPAPTAPKALTLSVNASSVGFRSAVIKLDEQNCGVLNFTNVNRQDLLQPTSSFFTETNDPVNVHYFDENDYNEKSSIEVFYFPYPRKSVLNAQQGGRFATRMKLANRPLKTNLLDGFGFQATLANEVEAQFAYTEFKEGDVVIGPFYHFTPIGKVELLHKNDKVLFGLNGTEAFSEGGKRLTLTFEKEAGIKVSGDGLVTSMGSCTCMPRIADGDYHLDSERSPLFANSTAETPYRFLKKAAVGNLSLPLVPTLSLKENGKLAELEEVFKKVRLDRVKLAATKFLEAEGSYITPQGFLKSSEGYNFIKSQVPAGTSALEPDTAAGERFQFHVFDENGDIDLSLQKDQVFFVMTPRLFQEYMARFRKSRFEIRFLINNSSTVRFTVDLLSVFPTETTLENQFQHDNAIVFFKFHREKVSSLIDNVEKWTNHGVFLRGQNDKSLREIQEDIEKNKLVARVKDDYFRNTILEDANWNGVFILNIPIKNEDGLPGIFNGLACSQHRSQEEYTTLPPGQETEKLKLKTELCFSYVAFPVNKTTLVGNSVKIRSTSFFGLLDYDPFENDDDYKLFSDHLLETDSYKFILSKLLVRFANSAISEFESFAFLKVHNLFDDAVDFGEIPLSHMRVDAADTDGIYPPGGDPYRRNTPIENLIRLKGKYQQTINGQEEVRFDARLNGKIKVGKVIDEITVKKVGFSYSGNDAFRFDVDAFPTFRKIDVGDIFSFDGLELQNIGLVFDLPRPDPRPSGVKFKLPSLKFDLSRIIVLPRLNFDGNGFLKSFPIRFNSFRNFKFKRKGDSDEFDFYQGDFDFFKLPGCKLPNISPGVEANLFSFVFDVDLGTLGDLDALKALKGQLLIGWSFQGGFLIGFKLAGPSSDGLHLDLFGAVKLDIDQLDLCSFKSTVAPGREITTYFLRVVNARLTIFGKEFPGKEDFDFNGVIYATPGSKVAWFLAATKPNNPEEPADKNTLKLGLGQRVGLAQIRNYSRVDECIADITQVFQKGLDPCKTSSNPVTEFYQPARNWLIGSSNFLPASWPIEIAGVFNDPVLYGIHLGFKGEVLKGFSIDILYKKLADNLGVYSMEWQLPDAIRNQELGGAFLKLPNIGIEIFTNGDWKVDIGFPRGGGDWSRSGFIQLRTAPPLVGWFGFYAMASKMASMTLFKGYISDKYSRDRLQIIQAGFALRVGVGFYFDKGILFVGASISVYGILEGAFAFEKNDGGLKLLFPDHFAVRGRVGAIAELVGYVDFGIIKASVSISLRVEFGLLLVYLGRDMRNNSGAVVRRKGLQPVKLYVEGEVRVRVSIKIGCVKIHLSFRAYVRFEFSIGGSGGNELESGFTPFRSLPALEPLPRQVEIAGIRSIPVVYLPSFTKVLEKNATGVWEENLLMIHGFLIPFLGTRVDLDENGSGRIRFPERNILKDLVIFPFLKELIEKIPVLSNYEALRHFLATGKIYDGQKETEVDIKLPNYVPTLIRGINSSRKDVVTPILTQPAFGFGFGAADVRPAPGSPGDYSIINAYHRDAENSLLMIPTPISARLQVVDSAGKRLGGFDPAHPQPQPEFSIRISGLVKDEAGSAVISKNIGSNRITEEDRKYIKTFFDRYKTQFLERQDDRAQALDEVTYEKREDIMVPEFFKLAALLLVERFHQFATAEYKALKGVNYKESEVLNPTIRILDLAGELQFHYSYQYSVADGNGNVTTHNLAKQWQNESVNGLLEDVAGQLNYFYNNGLRLPLKNKDEQTRSIYEFADQYSRLHAANPIPSGDAKDVSVLVAGVDITRDVFADNAAIDHLDTGVWKFIKGFGPDRFDFASLKREFVAKAGKLIRFVAPFEVIPVTLSLQNSRLEGEGGARYFELPKRLMQHGKAGDVYQLQINYASYGEQDAKGSDKVERSTADQNGGFPAGVSVCMNIQVKVKRHKTNTDEGQVSRIVEITNVFADDLNLLYTLYHDKYRPAAFQFYYKPEPSSDQPDELVKMTALTRSSCTILKTNLSPRTSPPLMDIDGVASLDDNDANARNEYWEDSNGNSLNFIRLLWESLTTNNGGYYLIMDRDVPEFKDERGEILDSWNMVVSIKANTQIPYYFNALRMGNEPEVFAGLREKTHYLYLGDLFLNGKPVKEYHATMPAHTFSFELKRDRSKMRSANYQNYLPLEFELYHQADGKSVLNADQVLPIMPVTRTLGEEPEALETYSHISPLVVQDKLKDPGAENEGRYACVGRMYSIRVNLRDVYGFRTAKAGEFLAEEPYRHYYFDKLIPVDAWPLLRFSYWLSDTASAANLLFDLRCGYELRDILDLSGIPKDKGIYRYDFGQRIRDEDLERLRETIPGILKTISTVVAQLVDENVQLAITYTEGSVKNKIVAKLLELKNNLKHILSAGALPKKESVGLPLVLPLKVPVSEGVLKQELSVSLSITRDKKLAIHAAPDGTWSADGLSMAGLEQNDIWEYDAVYSVATTLQLFNPAPSGNSSLSVLNEALRRKTVVAGGASPVSRFCIGLSSQMSVQNKGKVVYLINEQALSDIKPLDVGNGKFLPETCYWGIKPYSNKLWSGEYSLSLDGKPTERVVFSNVDLDKALKVVLGKIDQLLSGSQLHADLFDGDPATGLAVKGLYERLIGAKKTVADAKLKGHLGLVGSKDDSVRPPATLVNEFRELILRGLDNFYAYDGMIRSKIRPGSLDILNGPSIQDRHRLTLNLKSQQRYNLLSSKIGFSVREERMLDEWSILFDQQEGVAGDISFDVKPEITHLEFDISIPDAKSEVEHATWIHLVTPITLKHGPYAVEAWPKIKREFPDKPVILKQEAVQTHRDDGVGLAKWDSSKAGQWYCAIEIKNSYDLDTDRIHVELELKTANRSDALDAPQNFEGFISYWSQKIASAKSFDWRAFTIDLDRELAKSPAATLEAEDAPLRPRFVIRKVGGKWDKADVVGIDDPARVVVKEDAETRRIVVRIGGFDIFEPDPARRVISVTSQVKVSRNFAIPNEKFHYETDTVKAATSATPQIRYYYPIALERLPTAFASMVFGKIPSLPFKATAKYLIDTAGKDAQGGDRFPKVTRNLPVIPVHQIECAAGTNPSKTDALFTPFDAANGYKSFSLTVYNGGSGMEDDLAVFHADAIFTR